MQSISKAVIAIFVIIIVIIGFITATRYAPVQLSSTFTLVKANWAGYVVQSAGSDTFSYLNGSWTVPKLSCSSVRSAMLAWVGFGNASGNGPIEQIGTREDCNGGIASYSTWYEFWPQQPNTMKLSLAIEPGDNISASVNYIEGGTFAFLIKDLSTGLSNKFTNTSLDSSLQSAEWIVEAPLFTNGTRLVMADFGSISFQNDWAVIGNHDGRIPYFSSQSYSNAQKWEYICGGQIKAEPTQVGNDGAFSVYWNSVANC